MLGFRKVNFPILFLMCKFPEQYAFKRLQNKGKEQRIEKDSNSRKC